MGRLLLLVVVAVFLAPGTWVRTPFLGLVTDERQMLTLTPLHVPSGAIGEVEVAGLWHLESPNSHFEGYSALLTMGDGTLLGVTDWGRRMRLRPPGAGPVTVRFDYFATLEVGDKRFFDLEGVTRDPASGKVWGVYENTNQIERYDSRLLPEGFVQPAQMRNWPSNTGPEAIVRLADGRFIVLSEGSPRWFATDLPALLFAGDPVAGAAAASFRFVPPEGFRPVDMTLLPDGRVLILLRRVVLGLPPRFENKLVVADPARIQTGKRWSGQEIVYLKAPLPMDNFEGVAVEPASGDSLAIWLISDDNKAVLQRTLLLKLLWRPNEKAREKPRAPS